MVNEYRRGRLGQDDVCDAHPELLRAARYMGEKVHRACPVCDKAELRLLAYVYADDLKRDNGRVWKIDRGIALAAEREGRTCYVVEVCTGCSWNHLSEAFVGRSAG